MTADHLDDVEQALERVAELVDDLLTLARQSDQPTELQPITLPEFVRRSWQHVPTSDATLVVSVDGQVTGDPGRIRQLFENLFRNAIEHGGEDVTVTVGNVNDGFYVEDDGPGIPDDERSQVLEPGYSTSRNGTGFGLSIVSQIAEAHDWDTRVTDGTEGGARVEITGVEFIDE